MGILLPSPTVDVAGFSLTVNLRFVTWTLTGANLLSSKKVEEDRVKRQYHQVGKRRVGRRRVGRRRVGVT